MEKVMKKSEKKKIITLTTLVICIILIVAFATYAWFVWYSKDNTELTMTVGNLAEVKFDTGNDISEDNMGPVLNYLSDGEMTTFNIKNKADYSYYIDIILNISSIDNDLVNGTFKYVILESNNNSDFDEIASGNFADLSIGNNIISNVEVSASSTKYYKFIMYIDGKIINDNSMMNKSISGYISAQASNTN